MKGTGEYPPDWEEIAEQIKGQAGWKCESCRHGHHPATGYTLTVHHLDGDKGNCQDWNLAALCQRCHLHIQGKVFLPQSYMFMHTGWMLPHVEGYYKSIRCHGERTAQRDRMGTCPKCGSGSYQKLGLLRNVSTVEP